MIVQQTNTDLVLNELTGPETRSEIARPKQIFTSNSFTEHKSHPNKMEPIYMFGKSSGAPWVVNKKQNELRLNEMRKLKSLNDDFTRYKQMTSELSMDRSIPHSRTQIDSNKLFIPNSKLRKNDSEKYRLAQEAVISETMSIEDRNNLPKDLTKVASVSSFNDQISQIEVEKQVKIDYKDMKGFDGTQIFCLNVFVSQSC